jgi:hypothetical protein
MTVLGPFITGDMMDAQLMITMDDAGSVKIEGNVPLSNRILLYGLLDTVRDIVQKWNEEQERKVQPASVMPNLKLPGS